MPEVKSKVGQLEIGGHKKGLNAPLYMLEF